MSPRSWWVGAVLIAGLGCSPSRPAAPARDAAAHDRPAAPASAPAAASAPASASQPAGPAPEFTKTPASKYRCTRYLVPGAEHLTFPPGMKVAFTLTAKAPDRAAVRFEASELPPGATFDGAKGAFAWKADGPAGRRWPIDFAAVSAAGGRAHLYVSLGVAEEDQRAAWRAGFGSPWPDCAKQKEFVEWRALDLNGDGRLDAIFFRPEVEGSGAYVVRVATSDGFADAGEVESTCSAGVETHTMSDGAVLISDHNTYCDPLVYHFRRVVDGKLTEVLTLDTQLTEGGTIRLVEDGGRIRGVRACHPERGTQTCLWRRGEFKCQEKPRARDCY